MVIATPDSGDSERGRDAIRRRRSRRTSGDSQTVTAGLLALAVAGSALAIGTVHLPVLLVISVCAFAAAADALRGQALGDDGLVLPGPALVCAALAVYTLLQATPLPTRLLEIVTPSAADVWERSLLPFGEPGPGWATLSLDPGASLVEVLKWMSYAAVFVAASAVSARRGVTLGLRIVFVSAVAVAVVTDVHALAEATKVYGLYKPALQTVRWHVGPLLNPNNLAGYLNLGALLGLGLMLGSDRGSSSAERGSDRSMLRRGLDGVGVAVIIGTEVQAASRAGLVSLVGGVALLALFTRRVSSASSARARASGWMLFGVVIGGAVFAILGGTDAIWSNFRDKDLAKLQMARIVAPLVRDYPVFGIGRGAFESVFPMYRTTIGNVVFTHAENFVLQWVAEWGIPVALVALVAFAWFASPRRLGALGSVTAAGAWCGAAALVAQNLLDLGLELPSLSIALVMVLGTLWGDRHVRRHRDAVRVAGPLSARMSRLAGGGALALGAVLAILAFALGRHSVGDDRREAGSLTLPGTDPARARSFLHAAMSRHPAEPFFPLVGAALATRSRAESPLPWLERSLERAQVNGSAHLLLANVLLTRGARSQALLEVRLGLEDDPSLLDPATDLALGWARSFEELLAAVPLGKQGSVMLSTVGARLRGRNNTPAEVELGTRADVEAIARDPAVVEPREREAQARIDALAASDAGPLCADRALCREQVLEHARAIATISPRSSLPAVLRARLLVADGRPEEAVSTLEAACGATTDQLPCQRARVIAAAGIKAPELLEAASKALLGAGCPNPKACADIETWLAGVRVTRGETGAALGLLARAAREDPSDDARWLSLADVASQAGVHSQAIEALERVQKRRRGDAVLKQRIEAERTLLRDSIILKPR